MSTKPLIVADQPGLIVEEALSILEKVGKVSAPESYDQDELKCLLKDAIGLFSWGNIKFPDDLLAQAPSLRVIGVVGVGCDHIDLAGATRRGIVVGNGPGSNSEAVAEFAILLILALTRHFIRAQAAIKAQKWVLADDFLGKELRQSTLGIVGLGHIGRRVAEIARGFGMVVYAYDPYVSADVAQGLNITLTDLGTVLSKADVLSIHSPLTHETKGLIGADQIKMMKKGAILVNTGRAPIVDEDALYDALRSGHLMAAASDVFPKEPPDLTRPIYALDNFTATPHIASISPEALRDMQIEAAKAIAALLSGERPISVVNPDVLK